MLIDRIEININEAGREIVAGYSGAVWVVSILRENWPLYAIPREWLANEYVAGAFNLKGEHAAQACDEARDASRSAQCVAARAASRARLQNATTTRAHAANIVGRAVFAALDCNDKALHVMHVQIAFEYDRHEMLRKYSRESEHSILRAQLEGSFDAVRDALASIGFEF